MPAPTPLRNWLMLGACLLGAVLGAAPAVSPADIETLRRDAEAGNALSQWILGMAYEDGVQLPADPALAFKWHLKAAEQGVLLAQKTVADMYREGRGTKPDIAQAVVWWAKAAEQGDAISQANLSTAYALGDGVAKDEAKSASWALRAARVGEAGSQNNIGDCYETGRGVAKDLVEAHAWYSLAAAQGKRIALTGVSSVEAKMTPEQIQSAHQRREVLRKEVEAAIAAQQRKEAEHTQALIGGRYISAPAGKASTTQEDKAGAQRQGDFIVSRNGNSFNIEAKGNLAPNKPFKGTTLEEIQPENNPIDLVRRALELWPSQPKAAHMLRTAANLRAAFDAERVSDRTATAANSYVFDDPAVSRIATWANLSKTVGPAESRALLAWARKAGPPTYHPSWMIQHGMEAMDMRGKTTADGLKPNFDAAAAWKKICDKLERQANDETAWRARESQRSPETIQAMLGFLENGGGANLDRLAPSTAEAGKAKMRAIVAGFDPAGADPAMQFVEIRDALERAFDEAYSNHRGQK